MCSAREFEFSFILNKRKEEFQEEEEGDQIFRH